MSMLLKIAENITQKWAFSGSVRCLEIQDSEQKKSITINLKGDHLALQPGRGGVGRKVCSSHVLFALSLRIFFFSGRVYSCVFLSV